MQEATNSLEITKPRRDDPTGFRVNKDLLKFSRLNFGSPFATLFITVLFLRPLTEYLSYQRVIKDQAVACEAEAALSAISSAGRPEAGVTNRVVSLSQVVSQTCRKDHPHFQRAVQCSHTTSQARYSLRTIRTITPPVSDTEYR